MSCKPPVLVARWSSVGWVWLRERPIDGRGCLAADAVQVGSQGGHSIGVEPVDPACAFCSGHDEAAIFEDAKVLGHCRPADRQVLGQLTHRARVPGQEVRAALGLTEGTG